MSTNSESNPWRPNRVLRCKLLPNECICNVTLESARHDLLGQSVVLGLLSVVPSSALPRPGSQRTLR